MANPKGRKKPPKRHEKPLIYVFCEGESEQRYAEFLKQKFRDSAVLKIHSDALKSKVFENAQDLLKKNANYMEDIQGNVIDEIWLFFDVEAEDREKWQKREKIVKKMRKLRKRPEIRVRLLMTTGCVEYWFLLHYEKCRPPIQTPEQKDRILSRLKNHYDLYMKGDKTSIFQIAGQYLTAKENGFWALHQAQQEGLPTLEDTDKRNQWLLQSGLTFTTVQEAVRFLEEQEKLLST